MMTSASLACQTLIHRFVVLRSHRHLGLILDSKFANNSVLDGDLVRRLYWHCYTMETCVSEFILDFC